MEAAAVDEAEIQIDANANSNRRRHDDLMLTKEVMMTVKCEIEAQYEAARYEGLRRELTPYERYDEFDFRFTGDGKTASFTCRHEDVTVIWIDGPLFTLISTSGPTKTVNLAPKGGMMTLTAKLCREADRTIWQLIHAYRAEYGDSGASIAA